MNIANVDYLDRVRRLAALYTSWKSSDLMDGNFASMQHGRSMDFDDLREYRYGDEISDIDWKSSSRTGRTLVRRYFAERKHNALFICDTSDGMDGDTPGGVSKAHLALMTFGVCAYLMDKQGIDYALACSEAGERIVTGFHSGAAHLERALATLQNALKKRAGNSRPLEETLEELSAAYPRHLILFVITDAEGLARMDEKLVRRMVSRNDVYLFRLEDAYLTTPDAFDMQKKRFEDFYLTADRELRRQEEALRAEMAARADRLLTSHRAFFRGISREAEILDALRELLQRRKGGVRA